LTGRLAPDFKTIADFRRVNGPAIRKVCAQFITFCCRIDLLDASIVAIDGSKFKAVNAKAKSFTREKLQRRLGEIDAAVERYMAELDRADEVVSKTSMPPVEAGLSRTIKKLAHYRKEADALRAIEWRMDNTGETQVSLTDPDCRAMATTSKQPRVVGYNVQSAVETKHHLIIAHEVTNHGYDRDALSMMARKARAVMAVDEIEGIADKGYCKGERSLRASKAGIAVTVPKPRTSNAGAAGPFRPRPLCVSRRRRCLCVPQRGISLPIALRTRRPARRCVAIGPTTARAVSSGTDARPASSDASGGGNTRTS
jgi:hypothetical protein